MRGLTIAEIRCTEALITEADATATAIAAVLGEDAIAVQEMRATADWLRGIRGTGVLVSDSKAASETVALPDPPWPCGHRELTPGCGDCGDITVAWWAETKRRTAEMHGQTTSEFYGS